MSYDLRTKSAETDDGESSATTKKFLKDVRNCLLLRELIDEKIWSKIEDGPHVSASEEHMGNFENFYENLHADSNFFATLVSTPTSYTPCLQTWDDILQRKVAKPYFHHVKQIKRGYYEFTNEHDTYKVDTVKDLFEMGKIPKE